MHALSNSSEQDCVYSNYFSSSYCPFDSKKRDGSWCGHNCESDRRHRARRKAVSARAAAPAWHRYFLLSTQLLQTHATAIERKNYNKSNDVKLSNQPQVSQSHRVLNNELLRIWISFWSLLNLIFYFFYITKVIPACPLDALSSCTRLRTNRRRLCCIGRQSRAY